MSAASRLGDNLLRLLKARDKHQIDLADASGLSQAQISQIINEKRNTPFENLDAFAATLNVDVCELFLPLDSAQAVSGLTLPVIATGDTDPSSTVVEQDGARAHGSGPLSSPDTAALITSLAEATTALTELRAFVSGLSNALALAATGHVANGPISGSRLDKAAGGDLPD